MTAVDRRSLMGRLSGFAAALGIPAAATAQANASPAVQDSVQRALQRKVDEVASLADQLQIDDFDDVAMAARLAFDHADTRGGRGVSLRVPPRVMRLNAPLRMPDRIALVGAGIRDTIFQANHDGPMFVFDSVERAGLSGMRLGLGKNPHCSAIRIETRQGNIRRLCFEDIEIAGGGRAGSGADGGQTGLSIQASNGHVAIENTFDRLAFYEIDRPVVERSTEGNEWTRFVVDQFGYNGGAAFDSVAHASHYQGRIAGAPGAGATGFRQHGFRNMMFLRVDIGNASRAVDLGPQSRNIVMLQRPEDIGPPHVQTPIGAIAGNTVIDGDDERSAAATGK